MKKVTAIASGTGTITDFSQKDLTSDAIIELGATTRTFGRIIIGDPTLSSGSYNRYNLESGVMAWTGSGTNNALLRLTANGGNNQFFSTGTNASGTGTTLAWTLNSNLDYSIDGAASVSQLRNNLPTNGKTVSLIGSGTGYFGTQAPIASFSGSGTLVVDNPYASFIFGATIGSQNVSASHTG